MLRNFRAARERTAAEQSLMPWMRVGKRPIAFDGNSCQRDAAGSRVDLNLGSMGPITLKSRENEPALVTAPPAALITRNAMKFFSITLLLFATTVFAQIREKGPYTLYPIIPGVVRIEDSNTSNPPGIHLDAEGKPAGLNNCSDMYLIVGKDHALLIDLSNFVKWDATAVTSLQTLVAEEIGARKLFIAVTHFHGDHTGMLPAFRDNPDVTFWIQTSEFKGKELFPAERTTPIADHPTLDLGGGFVVNALEIPGHTDHSTAYFLKGKNLLFSGDGIGSGHGVWIFSAEGFAQYRQTIDRLISYVRTPANAVDESKLLIFGAHYWQKREKEKLTMQYLLDMKKLIGEIKAGQAREERVTFGPYLNTNFISGEATITWNKADAEKYRAE